jgi:hypothetical protein
MTVDVFVLDVSVVFVAVAMLAVVMVVIVRMRMMMMALLMVAVVAEPSCKCLLGSQTMKTLVIVDVVVDAVGMACRDNSVARMRERAHVSLLLGLKIKSTQDIP